MTYYIYHIPGKKIGVTCDLNNRVTVQQGYGPDEYEVLETSEDVDYISDVIDKPSPTLDLESALLLSIL